MANNHAAEEKKSNNYKLLIDQRPYDWDRPTITGAQIKALAGVDQSYGVWMQVPGPNDPEIADNEQVDLSQPGRDRFFTGKKTTTEGSNENSS